MFQVTENSLASKVGLTANDFLVTIAGRDTADMTHDEVSGVIVYTSTG